MDFYSCHTLTVVAGLSRAWVLQTQEQDSCSRCQWMHIHSTTQTPKQATGRIVVQKYLLFTWMW